MSDEIIKPPTTSDNSLAPTLSYIGNKTRIKFAGGCLKQDKITFIHGKTVIMKQHYLWNEFVELCRQWWSYTRKFFIWC